MRSMHCFAWLLTSVLAIPGGVAVGSEEAVRTTIQDYVVAFNAKDFDAVSKAWSENATHLDHNLAQRTDGRDQIVGDIKTLFEEDAPIKISGTVEHVRMITDSVASVDGQVAVTNGADAPVFNHFSAILKKQGDQWLIDSMEEMPIPTPASAADAISQLEWLVGSWQDADTESPVRATVRRSIGGSFLIRSFQATAADGSVAQSTQIIGWDPIRQQLRSWTFDADGSFGEGMWSRNGDEWLIKATQTLADGRTASGTYILTPESNDAFAVQLVGREIEGELQPSTPSVMVRRVEVSDEPEATVTTTQQ